MSLMFWAATDSVWVSPFSNVCRRRGNTAVSMVNEMFSDGDYYGDIADAIDPSRLTEQSPQYMCIEWNPTQVGLTAYKQVTTCRTCSTSCSKPLGQVWAVSMPRCPSAAKTLLRAAARLLGLRFSPHTMRPSKAPTEVYKVEGCKTSSCIWLTYDFRIALWYFGVGACTDMICCKLQCKTYCNAHTLAQYEQTDNMNKVKCWCELQRNPQARLAMNCLKASTRSACITCKVTQQHPISKGVLQQRGSLIS